MGSLVRWKKPRGNSRRKGKNMAQLRRKPEELLALQAEQDGNARVAQLFRLANRAINDRGEITAVSSFRQYEGLDQGEGGLQEDWLADLENLEEVDYYICSVCALVREHKPHEKCGRCQADPSAFFRTA
jgi:rubrerythrin